MPRAIEEAQDEVADGQLADEQTAPAALLSRLIFATLTSAPSSSLSVA